MDIQQENKQEEQIINITKPTLIPQNLNNLNLENYKKLDTIFKNN